MSGTGTPEFVEHASPLPFDDTVARLARAIESHGMSLFARIDHAANAREAGMSMPPTTVLIYGNPKGGTPLMLAAPKVALDLPLRVLVRQREDGTAMIGFHPVAALHRAGVPEELAMRLEPAQKLLLAAVDLAG